MSKSSFFSNTGPSNTQNTAIESSVSGAAASATAAAASATSAASSAASASANVTNNAASAAASEVSRQASLVAKNAAVVAKSAAETAETNSANSATASANSATASANSATASEASKATSTTKASEASTSASTAATKSGDSETARAASVVAKDASVVAKNESVAAKVLSVAAKDASVVAKNAAVTAQNNASASAQTATTKASEASTSAATATTKASQAATSATASEASKVTSVNSASTATTKASEASTSAASAAASYDFFDDRMLGAKSSAPTVDNDGASLVQGTLYFDTSSQTMKVYGSSGWVPAGSSVNGTSARFKFVSTNNQTTFSGSDANSQTLVYDAGFLDVYLSGLRLVNGTDFTATTGTNIVLAAGAATGDILEIVAYGTFVLANFNADKLDGQHGSYYTGYTDTAVSNLVDSSPAALNTLNELAAALGDDVNFSTTVNNSIATKAPLANPTFTGTTTIPTADINAGTIDGTTVGASSASTGAFTTLSASGDVNFDSGTLFVDVSANKVGIGTSSPSAPLSVVAASGAVPALGAASSHAAIGSGGFGTMIGTKSTGVGYIQQQRFDGTATAYSLALQPNGGNVGIGTASPSYALDVVSSATNNENLARFSSAGGVRAVFNTDSDDDGSLSLYDKSDAAKVLIRSLGNSYLNGGNLGIGTASPNSLVDIKGIHSQLRLTDSDDNKFLLFSYSGGKLVARNNSTSTTVNQFTLTEDGKFGIGTTNPDDGDLQIGDANSAFTIAVAGARTKFGYNGANAIVQGGSSKGVAFCVNNGTLGSGEAMRIDSSGRVGIGTASPAASTKLHISSGVNNTPTTFRIENTDQSIETNQEVNAIEFYTNDASASGTGVSAKIAQTATNPGNQYGLAFSTYNTSLVEAMRIDASGNLLVGKTSSSISTEGNVLFGSGGSWFTNSASSTADFNRLSTDGDVIRFKKDGTSVGSIASKDGDIVIGTNDTGVRFRDALDAIYPANASTQAGRDNAIDLGTSSHRFDDIYATNGTIQTSDRNEKQDIAELSDAEQRVAVACKGLLRKFRWKDSVAEKGDEARTHFGIIAQDLQAAFAAEGLDAGDYAMFISTTWTDEETNEEKTRMGVRYSELLAFIISAI